GTDYSFNTSVSIGFKNSVPIYFANGDDQTQASTVFPITWAGVEVAFPSIPDVAIPEDSITIGTSANYCDVHKIFIDKSTITGLASRPPTFKVTINGKEYSSTAANILIDNYLSVGDNSVSVCLYGICTSASFTLKALPHPTLTLDPDVSSMSIKVNKSGTIKSSLDFPVCATSDDKKAYSVRFTSGSVQSTGSFDLSKISSTATDRMVYVDLLKNGYSTSVRRTIAVTVIDEAFDISLKLLNSYAPTIGQDARIKGTTTKLSECVWYLDDVKSTATVTNNMFSFEVTKEEHEVKLVCKTTGGTEVSTQLTVTASVAPVFPDDFSCTLGSDSVEAGSTVVINCVNPPTTEVQYYRFFSIDANDKKKAVGRSTSPNAILQLSKGTYTFSVVAYGSEVLSTEQALPDTLTLTVTDLTGTAEEKKTKLTTMMTNAAESDVTNITSVMDVADDTDDLSEQEVADVGASGIKNASTYVGTSSSEDMIGLLSRAAELLFDADENALFDT
ncbi:hypothetical protein ADUPG1_011569, partial [Aduncisulcus paluster]